MPLLGPDDALPYRPDRVVVVGTSGSGKTTVARKVAAILVIPHIEIDGLFHGPHWTPRDAFTSDVNAFSAQEQWVTEWQYGVVRDVLADRADLMVWLDLGRATVMRQVVLRTLRRRLRREVLWNGNVEPPLWTVITDRNHIVRWAWSTHHKSAGRVLDVSDRRTTLPIVELTNHAEADRWLVERLTSAAPYPHG